MLMVMEVLKCDSCGATYVYFGKLKNWEHVASEGILCPMCQKGRLR
jgi:hypothetical protein